MKYFGTDGIRRESEFFDQENFIFRFAQAIVKTFFNSAVVIGGDTRLSGESNFVRLREAFNSLGVNVYDLGIVPTPEVCYYTREMKGAVGIMISASHNPPEFNGLKVVDGNGFKIDGEVERVIEEYIDIPTMQLNILHGDNYTVSGASNYIRRILHGKGECFRGKRVLLDCAYGSASGIAKKIFTSLGASVDTICDEPDGGKINVDCGATHIENIRDRAAKYDIAFAYDGDADRTLAVMDNTLIDGDDMIFALAQYHHAAVVAVTKMSNYGLDIALRNKGIDIIRVEIGDKHVQEAVVSGRAAMGAEQSGHVILSQEYCTGDGILASVEYLIAICGDSDRTFHKLAQCLLNVRADRAILARLDVSVITREIEADGGRVLIRASGTEPLIRVLVEADTQAAARGYAERIVRIIERRAK